MVKMFSIFCWKHLLLWRLSWNSFEKYQHCCPLWSKLVLGLKNWTGSNFKQEPISWVILLCFLDHQPIILSIAGKIQRNLTQTCSNKIWIFLAWIYSFNHSKGSTFGKQAMKAVDPDCLAISVHNLGLPQASQRASFYWKVRCVAPPQGTSLRTHVCVIEIEKDREEKHSTWQDWTSQPQPLDQE